MGRCQLKNQKNQKSRKNRKKDPTARRIPRGKSAQAKANLALMNAAFRSGFIKEDPKDIIANADHPIRRTSTKFLFHAIINKKYGRLTRKLPGFKQRYHKRLGSLAHELLQEPDYDAKALLTQLGLRVLVK